MSVTTFLIVCGTIVVGFVVLALACVGTLFTLVRAWRRFVAWLAQPHVEIERRRGKVRLARLKHVAGEREEAMLRGASVMANELLRTAVESQLQHLACREDEHRRHDLRMLNDLRVGFADQRLPITDGESRIMTDLPASSNGARPTAPLAIHPPWVVTARR